MVLLLFFLAFSVILETAVYAEDSSDGFPYNCTQDYFDFEDATFPKRGENILHLYEAFFPPNRHLPYSVVIQYQTLMPNGTLLNVTSDSVDCASQQWLWSFSPSIYLATPAVFNRVSLFMMNYFREWNPPYVVIRVPLPCPNVTWRFLLQMTVSLLDYSQERTGPNRNSLGYASVLCLNEMNSLSPTTNFFLSSKLRRNLNLPSNFHAFFLLAGSQSLTVLVLLSLIAVGRQWLANLVKLTKNYTYGGYGVYWGLSTVGTMFAAAVLYVYIETAWRQIKGDNYLWTILCFSFGFVIVSILIFCTYFGFKEEPIPIPLVYLVPFMFLCCGSKRYAQSTAFIINMCINSLFAIILVNLGLILILASLVTPFAILFCTATTVLILFCLINIFAILFTVFAFLCMPANLKAKESSPISVLRATFLILFLLSVTCLSTVVTAGGYLVNQLTMQNSFLSSFATFAIPLIIALLTIGLKHFIWYCVKESSLGGHFPNSGITDKPTEGELQQLLA